MAEHGCPELSGAESEEAEDERAGPAVQDGEDRVEVGVVVVGEVVEGGVGEEPGDGVEDDDDGESVGLRGQLLHHAVLARLRRRRVDQDHHHQDHTQLHVEMDIILKF